MRYYSGGNFNQLGLYKNYQVVGKFINIDLNNLEVVEKTNDGEPIKYEERIYMEKILN